MYHPWQQLGICAHHFGSKRTTNRSGRIFWNVIFLIALGTSDQNSLTFIQVCPKSRKRLFRGLALRCQPRAPSPPWRVRWIWDKGERCLLGMLQVGKFAPPKNFLKRKEKHTLKGSLYLCALTFNKLNISLILI